MPPPADFPPVRIGVAGLGRSGAFHLERIGLREDFQVVTLYDDCPAARERMNGPSQRVYASWGEFLGNSDMELVLLATPPALHAELAIQAMAAGKQVVVETPMSLNLAEADAVMAASVRTGRSISVAQTRRWEDDYLTARQVLTGGELGRPLAIKYINWHYNPRHRHDSADSGKAPADDDLPGRPPRHWRDHKATGGGVLWEFGTHCFDQLLQLTGRVPKSVYARLSFPNSDEALSDDAFLAILSYEDGLVAHIEVNRAAGAPLATGWTIAGEAGSYFGFTQYTPNPDGEVADLPVPAICGDADEYYAQLARHLRCGDPNPVPPAEARQALAVIEAVRRSARSGEAVAVEA
jgi:scyllo-inositol 2-dehydrogenase (NADP+)